MPLLCISVVQSFNRTFSEIGISLNCTFRYHCIVAVYKRKFCLYIHICFLFASDTVLAVPGRYLWFWLVSFLICFFVCISQLLFYLCIRYFMLLLLLFMPSPLFPLLFSYCIFVGTCFYRRCSYCCFDFCCCCSFGS